MGIKSASVETLNLAVQSILHHAFESVALFCVGGGDTFVYLIAVFDTI